MIRKLVSSWYSLFLFLLINLGGSLCLLFSSANVYADTPKVDSTDFEPQLSFFPWCLSLCKEGDRLHNGRDYKVCSRDIDDDSCTEWSPWNTIPDFSHAGYMGGGVAIPDVEEAFYVTPIFPENTAHIQSYIDDLALAIDQGLVDRGAVTLSAGTFYVWGTIEIKHSGIVLRGQGSSTIIKAMGDGDLEPKDYDNDGKIDEWLGRRRVIHVHGKNDFKKIQSSMREITDPYVPVGARSFHVSSTQGYAVGDPIIVFRDCNQKWIEVMGTDNLCNQPGCHTWKPEEHRYDYERRITAIDGNLITIDVPLAQAIDRTYGGGKIYKYAFPGRISQVGVEDLQVVSYYKSDTDEDHVWYGIVLENVENAWVRGITGEHIVRSCVYVYFGSRWVTVEDSSCLEPKSEIMGSRRYPFQFEKWVQLSLIQRCYADKARHAFGTGAFVTGPNVFLDCKADRSYSDDGPHHRWAHGILFDNLDVKELNVVKKYNGATGHGWTGGQIVFWNSEASNKMCLQAPPTSENYAIGCTAPWPYPGGIFCQLWAVSDHPSGYVESKGKRVSPPSLYLDQLDKRLGVKALSNIGWTQYQSCQDGNDDCDGDLNNGCENKLNANPHCGACNRNCARNINHKACVKKGSYYECGCHTRWDCRNGWLCLGGICEPGYM